MFPFPHKNTTSLNLLKKHNIHYELNPYHRRLDANEVATLAHDFPAIIASTEDLRILIRKSKTIKFISRAGIGLDNVPLGLCQEKDIRLSYTPDAVTMATAEISIAGILAASRHIVRADRYIRRNQWQRLIGRRIVDYTVGIIGCGRVGSQVIRLLSIFRPKKILINDVLSKKDFIQSVACQYTLNIEQVSKDTIYKNANIISLHVPLNTKTHHMINKDTLSLFRPESILINYARGELVDEYALYKALSNHDIESAVLDVFTDEPYRGELTKLDNVILTAHMGSCSLDCREQMELEATQNVIDFFMGTDIKNEIILQHPIP